MKKLDCYEYDGELFDIEFSDAGHVERIWMYISNATVDLIDVTHLMTDGFKENAWEKYLDRYEGRDLILAERHNDDLTDEPPGAA